MPFLPRALRPIGKIWGLTTCGMIERCHGQIGVEGDIRSSLHGAVAWSATMILVSEVHVFAGGGLELSPMSNYTRPLIRMSAEPDQVTFTLIRPFSRFLGPWVAPRTELKKVRVSDRRLGPLGGIELYFDAYRSWTFWCSSPERVLEVLAGMNYPTPST